MFLTETDMINLKLTAEKVIGDSDMIKNLIQEDISSQQRMLMRQGEKYYVGEHDISGKDFRKSTVFETDNYDRERMNGFSNPNRSNHHSVNAFHRVLVDQKVAYLFGKEPTVIVAGATENEELKEYEKYLSEFCDEYYNEKIQELAIDASNKGFSVIHPYYNESGEFKYYIVPGEEVILIYDTKHQAELEQVIRYYDITVIRDGEKYNRKRVEWWTKNDVTYYVENDNGNFPVDSSLQYNPSPHWWEVHLSNGFTKRRIAHTWGRVPFIVLKNNAKMTTDLQLIKGLIDGYDILSSQGINNFLDHVDLYWSIQGYGGEDAKAIIRKLQINRAVHVDSGDGKIQAEQIDLPVQGRIDFLKMLRRDIFHFGMGVDVDTDKFGAAPSGISLKFQYAQLDLKVNNFIPRLKTAIKELLWFATEDCNRRFRKNFDYKLVDITINKTIISNELERVQMVRESKGLVSIKTLIANHPFVDDVNKEITELEVEQRNAMEEHGDYTNFGDNHAE